MTHPDCEPGCTMHCQQCGLAWGFHGDDGCPDGPVCAVVAVEPCPLDEDGDGHSVECYDGCVASRLDGAEAEWCPLVGMTREQARAYLDIDGGGH